MKKEFLLMSLILIGSLLLTGCSESENTKESATLDTQKTIKEFEITANNWKFEPSSITVNKGDKVILHVTSTDIQHGIAINEFGISQDLTPGETVNIEFIADKKGEFLIFCNVFCGTGHSEMESTIIVI